MPWYLTWIVRRESIGIWLSLNTMDVTVFANRNRGELPCSRSPVSYQIGDENGKMNPRQGNEIVFMYGSSVRDARYLWSLESPT